MDGTEKGGAMTSKVDDVRELAGQAALSEEAKPQTSTSGDVRELAGQAALSDEARDGIMELFVKQCRLFTCGGSSSVTQLEADQLLQSISFVLEIDDINNPVTCVRLNARPIEEQFQDGIRAVEAEVSETMALWREVCVKMPPIKNIALRDTLASIGHFSQVYDIYFAAHEIPANIDYPLHNPIVEDLEGVRYIHEWLRRALFEAEYLAKFDTKECIKILKESCPDYKGLIINLYEPVHAVFGD